MEAAALGCLLGLWVGSVSGCAQTGRGEGGNVHAQAGLEYLEAGRCLEAEERLSLALEYGEAFAEAHNGLGLVAQLCRTDLDEAAQHFKDALAIEPDFAQAHNNLGVTFLKRNPAPYDQACEQFKAAIEIDPDYKDARENYGLCLVRDGVIRGHKGDVEARTERFREAKRHLVRLLELDPGRAEAQHLLGLMALVSEDYEEAESRLGRCLELSPESPACNYNLGNVYLLTARCESAIEPFLRAVRGGPNSGVALDAKRNLEVAFERCAQKDAALSVFMDRLRAEPGNPVHHFELGMLYAEKGSFELAISEWTSATKLDAEYCPPYYELAMVAHRNLDSQGVLDACGAYGRCAGGTRDAAVAAKVATCSDLVRQLQ